MVPRLGQDHHLVFMGIGIHASFRLVVFGSTDAFTDYYRTRVACVGEEGRVLFLVERNESAAA